MFSNLTKGSILHGVDRSAGQMSYFTGTIERVTPSVANQYAPAFGQFPALNLDIVINVDGKQREYKGIHSNDIIADFGPEAPILADNKDSLYNHIKSLLKVSEDAINEKNLEFHKNSIPQYRNVLSELRPEITNVSEVKELRAQIEALQSQFAEAITLLKGENNNKT